MLLSSLLLSFVVFFGLSDGAAIGPGQGWWVRNIATSDGHHCKELEKAAKTCERETMRSPLYARVMKASTEDSIAGFREQILLCSVKRLNSTIFRDPCKIGRKQIRDVTFCLLEDVEKHVRKEVAGEVAFLLTNLKNCLLRHFPGRGKDVSDQDNEDSDRDRRPKQLTYDAYPIYDDDIIIDDDDDDIVSDDDRRPRRVRPKKRRPYDDDDDSDVYRRPRRVRPSEPRSPDDDPEEYPDDGRDVRRIRRVKHVRHSGWYEDEDDDDDDDDDDIDRGTPHRPRGLGFPGRTEDSDFGDEEAEELDERSEKRKGKPAVNSSISASPPAPASASVRASASTPASSAASSPAH